MTFRRRLTVASAAAVAMAIALSSVVFFVAVRAQLRGQVDGSLRDQAGEVAGDFGEAGARTAQARKQVEAGQTNDRGKGQAAGGLERRGADWHWY